MLNTQNIQNQYEKLSLDKQAEFRQRVIYNIVDGSYGDRITDFVVDSAPKSGTVASGNFATPRLGGKKLIIDYAIKDSGVTLTPRNINIIDHGEEKYGNILESLFSFAENIRYVPVEFLSFGRTLQCEKGWACGGACLSKTKKNCHQALNPEHKTYVGWLKSQVQKGAALHKGHREEAEKLGLTKEKKEEPPQPQKQPQSTPKTKTKKKRETKSNLPKGIPTKYAEQWASAFNNSPQDLKDVLETLDQPGKIDSPTGKNKTDAFYRRSERAIAMGTYYEAGKSGAPTWRHEYGHHIDYEAEQIIGNNGDFGISSSPKGKESIASDNDHLVKLQEKSQKQDIANFEKYKNKYNHIVQKEVYKLFDGLANEEDLKSLPDTLKAKIGEQLKRADIVDKIADPKTHRFPHQRTEAITEYSKTYLGNDKGLAGSIYRELPDHAKEDSLNTLLPLIKLKQEGLAPAKLAKLVEDNFFLSSNVNDLVGSITVNKVGQGHKTEYYSDFPDHRRGTEAFANLNDLHGHGSEALQKVAEYLAPSTYKFYKGVLKDVVKARANGA